MKRYIFISFASILLLAVISTVLVLSPYRDRSLDQLLEDGVIRIGYSLEPPYAFLAEDGTVTGESPEVARHIVDRLGIARIEWSLSDFSGLIDGLNSGQFDVIAAGMCITADRQKLVQFSLPTFTARPGLLAATGNPMNLTSYGDLMKRTDAKIAVLSGSVEEARLSSGDPDQPPLVRVPDARSGLQMLQAGAVDGLALTAPTVRWMARSDATDSTMPIEFKDDSAMASLQGAFAFRKTDDQLYHAWNELLVGFVGTDEHLDVVAPFGFTRSDLPAAGLTDYGSDPIPPVGEPAERPSASPARERSITAFSPLGMPMTRLCEPRLPGAPQRSEEVIPAW